MFSQPGRFSQFDLKNRRLQKGTIGHFKQLHNIRGQHIRFEPRQWLPFGIALPQNRLAIADTGEGIPPDALDRLFQKYGRVEGQELGRRYDSGLGLVFCRMAVELLGGSISVASEVSKGTTFTMVFPVR